MTGASRGLGLALARSLAPDGWALVVDGRDPAGFADTADSCRRTVAIAGDVSEEPHRGDLATATAWLGGLNLLMQNAGPLGP